MSIIRYNRTPSRRLDSNSYFDSLFGNWGLSDTVSAPKPVLLEFWETKDSVARIELEVPGFKKEDLSVKLVGRMLHVNGKKENRNVSYRYALPKNSKSETLTARLEDGILTVGVEVSTLDEREVQIEVL